MIRNDSYMAKIVADALDREVLLDADVEMIRVGAKIKAWCPQTKTYLQFPREIRKKYKRLVADVVKSPCKTGKAFYRAYPGSIRESKEGKVLA